MKIRSAIWMLAIVAALGFIALGAGLAPAALDEPEPPEFARRPLSLEWNGARPDPKIDHMFRKGAAKRANLDDMFRRR